MEGQALKDGKKRVKDHLIDPLNSQGMVRKPSNRVADHDAFLVSLEARLSYMTSANLMALAEVVATHAEGARKNVWPAEVSIMNWARRLQAPPASDSRLVRSYLQSGAGTAAASAGYLVELYSHLKRFGAPPNDYSMSVIRQNADDNRRKRARIEHETQGGLASTSDVAWLSSYMDARRRCLDIMKAKDERAVA